MAFVTLTNKMSGVRKTNTDTLSILCSPHI